MDVAATSADPKHIISLFMYALDHMDLRNRDSVEGRNIFTVNLGGVRLVEP